ncbi:MAG: PDZ domain-containing protein [Candidatus Palauibacterales bacterium]|nr:PDZ domain-containing protein [Candidatus Palauibacterales bacterium]
MLSWNLGRCGRPLAIALLAGVGFSSSLFAQDERGWLGFRVSCTKCVLEETGDAVAWSFSIPPLVSELIVGSPAALAGILSGDTILSIDGVDITTDEGSRRFSALRASVPLAMRVRRSGREFTLRVTPANYEEVFGQKQGLALYDRGNWDSVRVELQTLSDERTELRKALSEAEEALQQTQIEATSTEEQRQLAAELRENVDSIRRQLLLAQARLRLQADSLAVRALYLTPRPTDQEADELRVGERDDDEKLVEARKATLVAPYQDAVAGARFQQMNEGLGDYFAGSEGRGLLLVRVVEGTPAYEAGLREGDVVISINGQPVESVEDLREQLSESGEAELVYIRKGKREKCTISSK